MTNQLKIKLNDVNYWISIRTKDPNWLWILQETIWDIKLYIISVIKLTLTINGDTSTISLNYENLYLLLERVEKCIDAKTQKATTLEYDWIDWSMEIKWALHLRYSPLTEETWILNIYEDKFPVIVNKEKIQNDYKRITSWKIDLHKTIKEVFKPIIGSLLENKNNSQKFFIDIIREQTWLSFKETIEYLKKLSDEELKEIIRTYNMSNLYLHWWEPKNVIRAVKRNFQGIKGYSYDTCMKTLWEKNIFFKNINDYLTGIIPNKIYNYIQGGKKSNEEYDSYCFSLLEMRNWVIRWNFWINSEAYQLYISCNNWELEKIRSWLESLIPNAQSPKKVNEVICKKQLTIWWEFRRPKITIKLHHTTDTKESIYNEKYFYYYGWITIQYEYFWKETEIFINTWKISTPGIISYFYKTITEFLTSEYFIDNYELQKIKYYWKEMSYKETIKKFESEKIEEYLWKKYSTYINYLKTKREKIKYRRTKN